MICTCGECSSAWVVRLEVAESNAVVHVEKFKTKNVVITEPPRSKHVPSTETVRECFLDGAEGEFLGVDFDAWLAQRDYDISLGNVL